MPRTLYINSSLHPSDPQAAALGRKVSRTLPGGVPAQHVYEMVVSEQEYLAGSSALAQQLVAEHVQGVYEERLPLALHAALQLGWAAGPGRDYCRCCWMHPLAWHMHGVGLLTGRAAMVPACVTRAKWCFSRASKDITTAIGGVRVHVAAGVVALCPHHMLSGSTAAKLQ